MRKVLGLVERHLLRLVPEHTRGNQSQASRILGIARPTLRQRLVAMRLIEGEPAPEEAG